MSEGEVWRDVVGYEGLYKVSDRGNVFSVERLNSQGSKCGGSTLKPSHTRGYPKVTLYKNGERKHKYVHRLVTEAFIPNPENHTEVNHLDEVKTNNELSNLEWCDARHNSNYGTRIERIVKKTSKKIRAVNVETGEVLTFSSTVEAWREGYSNADKACRGVYSTLNGKLIGDDGRTYRGYKWYYQEEGE